MPKRKVPTFDEQMEEYEGLIFKREEEEKREIVSIPTGSISLDVSTGIGGIPLGRFTEIYGAESSGKTTLALSICKNALNLGYKVLYDDVEQGLDLDYISRIVGDYDESQFIILRPETMEQALTVAEKAIKTKEFGLIVLDSIGSLSPKKVKDDELTDANVALLARLLTVFLQRNAYDVRYNDVAFLGVNQVRDKIGSYYATFETPGGHSWKHILSMRIQLSKATDMVEGGDKVGILTKFVIKKNKLAPPLRTFTFPIIFGEGIDSMRDLVEFSTMIGVLEKGGPYYKFDGETLSNGVIGTSKYLDEHPEILDKIIKACYTATKSKSTIDSEEVEVLEDE